MYGVGNATLYNPIRDAFMKRFPGIELKASISAAAKAARRSSPSSSRKNYVADVVISGTDTQNELCRTATSIRSRPRSSAT